LGTKVAPGRLVESWTRGVVASLGDTDLEYQVPHPNFVSLAYRVLKRSISFILCLIRVKPLSDILAIDESSISAAQVSDEDLRWIDVEQAMPAGNLAEL
jgi:hypothetical protein